MKNFLRLINIEVDDVYAEMLFQVITFLLNGCLENVFLENPLQALLTDVCTEM